MQNTNAGFRLRFFANVLDSSINLIIYLVPLLLFFVFSKVYSSGSVNHLVDLFVWLLTYAISAICILGVLFLVYELYFISKLGGTLGKLVFRLNIVDQQTGQFLTTQRAFYRTILGYTFSAAFLGLGFLRIIKHPQKLGWHDEIFDTKVISKGSYIFGYVALILALSCIVLIGILLVNYISLAVSTIRM